MATVAKVNANQKTARTVGALFLISNATFIVGAFLFVESILGETDYLNLVAESRSQLALGALLELANGVAYLGIAVLMYPILKQRFASMALGYFGFRVIEFIMQTLSSLSPLILVTISAEFVQAATAEASALQALGSLLLAERYWAFQMVSISLGLGALLFYTMLYQLQLIPRFISVWGLIGAVTVLTTVIIELFGISVSLGLGLVLGLPMLLNELFLGVWLIVKGFNTEAVVSESARPAISKT